MSNTAIRSSIFWSVVALLLTYIAYRAYVLSFTIDEAMSYNYVLGIWEDDLRANNHWLNTFLMRVFQGIFGPWEWSLRLPNVLSFLLYSTAVHSLLRRVKSDVLFYAATAILLFQPTYLEFFSLARGYGMGVAFFAFGFALLTSLTDGRELSEASRSRRYLGVIAMGTLVLFSYISALNVVLMLMGLAVLHAIVRWRPKRKTTKRLTIIWMVTFAVGSTIQAARLLLELKEDGELFIGTNTFSQWADDTFSYYFPGELNGIELLLRTATVTVAILMVIGGGVQWYRRKKIPVMLGLSILIGVGSLAGWFIQHKFMGANLPQDRTTMIYFFLFAVGIVGASKLVVEEERLRVAGLSTAVVLGALSIWNAATQYNVERTRIWPNSQKMRQAVLTADSFARHWHEPVHAERHYFFLSSLNYYFRTRSNNIVVDEKVGIQLEAELLFVYTEDFKYVFDYPDLIEQYERVATYPGDIALYVRKDVYDHAMKTGEVVIYE